MAAMASSRVRRTPVARRHRSVVRLGVFVTAVFIAAVYTVATRSAFDIAGADGAAGARHAAPHHFVRKLLSSDNSLYPPEAFSDAQLKRGAIVLHALGVLYTFIAIAMVCDDFFVPALEVLVAKYQIDDDVAGATFMAAGGSAPELFTALIGVFIAKSNVGFGTIIGSAVFNVLFVIGACAFFSRDVLSLTWWPIARDCFFYIVDLVVLFVFFLDQKIQLHESAVLLLLYAAYVYFMKHNARVERWFKTRVLRQKESDFAKGKTEDAARKAMNREASSALAEDAALRLRNVKSLRVTKNEIAALEEDDRDDASATSSGVRSPGSVRSVCRKLRGNSFEGASSSMDSGGKPSRPPDASALELKMGAGQPSSSSSPADEENGIAAPEANLEEMDALRKAAAAARTARALEAVRNIENDQGIDLSWPEDRVGQAYYIVACPLMFLLAYTIPNCKKNEKLWPLVFAEAILYIGFFSYFMVWWATQVGRIAGISDVVMGYTFLAAGTSVPDLMSSVIVARQGLGDMAVSSSIGSNIFDITFGLPLPWLIWSLANNFQVFPVDSDSLGFSLTLLIIMLVAVVSIIAQQGWMMTKTLGAAMIVLYGVFLALVLLNAGGLVAGF